MFNETNYISASALDFDANGDIAMTDTAVLAAPGAGYRIVLYGVNVSMAGSTAATAGSVKLDANTALNITGEESGAQAYAFGTVYYRIERT